MHNVMQISDMPALGLQRIIETIALLPNFKLKMHYQILETFKLQAFQIIYLGGGSIIRLIAWQEQHFQFNDPDSNGVGWNATHEGSVK